MDIQVKAVMGSKAEQLFKLHVQKKAMTAIIDSASLPYTDPLFIKSKILKSKDIWYYTLQLLKFARRGFLFYFQAHFLN